MRKQPRQARSRETVGVIVEGAAQVLARSGWSGFGTNEVATAAGVSIGSVYQYFPNRLALLDAIRHRHFEQLLQTFDRASGDAGGWEGRVARLIDGMIASHHDHPGLYRVLLEEAPKPDSASAVDRQFDLCYRQRVGELVAMTTGRTDPAFLGPATSVVAAAVEGLVHEAARREAAEARLFRDEVVRFVVAYLGANRIAASPAG
jgi:AcrR family transcriptional regulator